jgi:hypothetical protein
MDGNEHIEGKVIWMTKLQFDLKQDWLLWSYVKSKTYAKNVQTYASLFRFVESYLRYKKGIITRAPFHLLINVLNYLLRTAEPYLTSRNLF